MAENIIAGVSAGIAIIALIVSIYTSKKQNKIALFELKYKTLTQLKLILGFSECIKDIDDTNIILLNFNVFFNSRIEKTTTNETLQEVLALINLLRKDIFASSYLFKEQYLQEIEEIINSLEVFLALAIKNKPFLNEKNNFSYACKKFEENILPKLEKETSL